MDGSIVQHAPSHRRRSLRRALRLETEVLSDAWDGAIALLATDVSAHGLWLESELALGVGEDVIVSFLPPRWSHASPFLARACVARVGLLRRRGDRGGAGMGLSFVGLRADQATRLAACLRGQPPPLPRRALPAARQVGEAALVTSDGSLIVLRAEAALLTAARATPAATSKPRTVGSMPVTAPPRGDSAPATTLPSMGSALHSLSNSWSAVRPFCGLPGSASPRVAEQR